MLAESLLYGALNEIPLEPVWADPTSRGKRKEYSEGLSIFVRIDPMLQEMGWDRYKHKYK